MATSLERALGSHERGVISSTSCTAVETASALTRNDSMALGVIDAGIAIGWLDRGHRSFARLDRLLRACRDGKIELAVSIVNVAEILIHTTDVVRATGVDALSLLKAYNVRIHQPDEVVARRVAKLKTSIADGFAAATAQELRARLHTTDHELARQLRSTRLSLTLY